MNELGKAIWQHLQEHAECADLLVAFPAIHYLVVDNMAAKSMYKANNLKEYRDLFQKDINDWAFYRKMMKQLLRKPEYLYSNYAMSQLATRLSVVKYLLDGNYFTLRIRNKLIYTFANIIDACNIHKKNMSS